MISLNDKRKKIQVCEDHFSSSDIGKKKLKSGAVPIFPTMELENEIDMEDPEKGDYCTSVAGCCSNCESYAKTSVFYRRKYYSLLKKYTRNNATPSVAEINNILARLMAARLLKMSPSTNCEDCTDTVEEDLANILTQQQLQEKIEDPIISDENQEIENCVADPFVDDFLCSETIGSDVVSLRYFLGYISFKIIPKIKCDICAEQLRKENEVLSAPSELFIFNKNYSSLKDFGNLIAPSQKFLEVSTVHIKIFKHIFSNEPHSVGIKTKIKENCFKASPEWFSICREHKEKILDFFILVLLRKHCVWSSEEKNILNKKRKLKIINS